MRARLLTLLSGLACSADAAAPPGSGSACVVASIGGEELTNVHVAAMQVLVQPAPSGDAAKRWAVDAALARWAVAGRIGDAPARAWLSAYRQTLADLPLPSDRRRWRERTAALAQLEAGPCFTAARDAGSAD